MRSTDHDELQRQAQVAQAQARLVERKKQKQDEMKPTKQSDALVGAKVFYARRRRSWRKALEIIGVQMLAIVYTAACMAVGFIAAVVWYQF